MCMIALILALPEQSNGQVVQEAEQERASPEDGREAAGGRGERGGG